MALLYSRLRINEFLLNVKKKENNQANNNKPDLRNI